MLPWIKPIHRKGVKELDMKKLDWNKISNKNPYEAPDGYFEKLPGIIQARVSEQKKSASWSVYLKWSVVPALAACLFVVFNWVIPQQKAPEDLLAEVSTEELIYYLELSDASTEDLVNQLPSDVFEEDFLYEDNMLDESLGEDELDQLIEMYDVDGITL